MKMVVKYFEDIGEVKETYVLLEASPELLSLTPRNTKERDCIITLCQKADIEIIRDEESYKEVQEIAKQKRQGWLEFWLKTYPIEEMQQALEELISRKGSNR